MRTGNAVLKAEIVLTDGSRGAETEISDNKNGTYEVGYALHSEGEYSFSLMLYGQPVRGSPFRLRAIKPSDVPQSPDDVKRRVKSPSGTGGHIRQKAVRRPSSMYSTTKKKENPIEDELIYRVGKTDPNLMQKDFKRLNSRLPHYLNVCFQGSRGREKGEFTNLQGISASSNGRVVVADSNNQCIQVSVDASQLKEKGGHVSPRVVSDPLSDFLQRRPVQDALRRQRSLSGTAAETDRRYRGHERRHRGG